MKTSDNPNRLPPPARQFLKSLRPYVPGEQPQGEGFIKLNTNEFPYPAARTVLQAVREAVDDSVRLYPDPTCSVLREALAERHSVRPEQIIIGNGSDEILRLLVHAYLGSRRRLAIVEPTYSLFEVLAAQFEAQIDVYLLRDAGERLPEELFSSEWSACLLPVPNPPLGTVFPESELKRLAEKGNLLVLDGAYIEFVVGCNPLLQLANIFPNVVLTFTFSKSFGLAGLRVGYAIGCEGVIADLHKLRDSYNVNKIAQLAALTALQAESYYRGCCQEIIASREWLSTELSCRGFDVHPSQGNFIFMRHAQAANLSLALRQHKILVRHFVRPLLPDGLRITIGTPQQLQKLLRALDVISKEGISQ